MKMKMLVSHIGLCEEVDKKDMPQFEHMPDGSYHKIDDKNYAVFMYGVVRQLNDYQVDFDSGYTEHEHNPEGFILHYF